jgi:hypothetical protein
MELDAASVQEIVEALLAEIKSVDRLIPDREEYPYAKWRPKAEL